MDFILTGIQEEPWPLIVHIFTQELTERNDPKQSLANERALDYLYVVLSSVGFR